MQQHKSAVPVIISVGLPNVPAVRPAALVLAGSFFTKGDDQPVASITASIRFLSCNELLQSNCVVITTLASSYAGEVPNLCCQNLRTTQSTVHVFLSSVDARVYL